MAKRWGVRTLIAVAILWILWVLSGSPWTTYALWRDSTQHESLFRQASADALQGLTVQATASEKAVKDLGYKIEVDHDVVLFYKYERFRGKGILGIAYAERDIPEAVRDWARFYPVPPHWAWLHMPSGFYVFAGR